MAAVATMLLATTGVFISALPALADADGRGGDYVALPAAGQLLDTRTGIGAAAGLRKGGVTTAFQVLGRAGVPASGVRAVLLDMTIYNSTATTHLRVFPDGQADTPLSFVNAASRTVVSNTGIVPVGASGRLNVINSLGDAHVIIDVHGYFRSDPGGPASGYVPVTPKRLIDTRNGTGTPAKSVAAGASLTVALATGTPVPANALSIMAEVAVVGAAAQGPLVAYATGSTSGVSVMDYAVGATSTNLGLRLGTSGRVTFVNKGSQAIHLVLDVGGYFVANSATGAGFNPVQARLSDTRTTNTPIAANGVTDMQIGGMAGLPTKGVAAVALNITVVSPVSAGHLKIYPIGAASPATSFNQFPAVTTRAGSAVVQPGPDGRIRIQNNSASPVNVIVDLHGWFADPRPVLPVRTFTRTSALQLSPRVAGQPGPIEYAYTDNLGSLVSVRQASPANFTDIQTVVVSEGEAFTGQPAIAELADKRTQIAGLVANGGDVWARTRTELLTNDWAGTAWERLGGSLTDSPVAGKLGDGRIVQFGVDSDGTLWQLAQGTPSGAYIGWRSLGDIDLAGAPAVVGVRDGNLQIFATTRTGSVRTATYYASGALSAWVDLGGVVSPGTLAAVVYPGSRLRIVGVSNGRVVTKAQSATLGWPASWDDLGGEPAGAPAAVLTPQDGRTYILIRQADGGIYRIAETAQGSGAFGPWNRFTDPAENVVTDPTAFVYFDGTRTTWAFLARDASQTIRFFGGQTAQFATARRFPEVSK